MEPVCNFSHCSMGNELWRIAIIGYGHFGCGASASSYIIRPVKNLEKGSCQVNKHRNYFYRKNENECKCILTLAVLTFINLFLQTSVLKIVF